MDSLPPDPYQALGLAKDATAGAIKSTYRKLVLKCHPDKVQDEALKQEAADRFHKIQSAYEIVGDEDRRARYDAQVKLAELRKDVFARDGGSARGPVDVRTAAYKMPTESRGGGGDFYARGPDRYARVSPQYEERRPSYAAEDYFDIPRATNRKYDEYERSTKRSSPKEDRPKAKASTRDAKESERSSRKEKSRRTEKDVRRERERKSTHATAEDDDSEYDSTERKKRAYAEEDLKRREREARDMYHETSRRQREDAESGAYRDIPGSKYLRQEQAATAQIRADMERRPASTERRPSPVRYSSSRDKINVVKQDNGKPPMMVRRGTDRPKPTTRDSVKSSRARDREAEYFEEVREPRRSEAREAKRPPTLHATKSAPPENIRPNFDRQRSYSVQEDQTEPAPPSIRRSETMPTSPPTASVRESRGRREGSKLRPDAAYATPERTPEPDVRTAKPRYGSHPYADDVEIPTPDGYEVEERVPPVTGRYVAHSPERMEERYRERQRPASAKHAAAPQPPPMMPRTTSMKYVYPDSAQYSRPAVSRENSRGLAFGEIPTTHSPKLNHGAYAPPPRDAKYQQRYEDRAVSTSKYDRPTNYSRESSRRQAVPAN